MVSFFIWYSFGLACPIAVIIRKTLASTYILIRFPMFICLYGTKVVKVFILQYYYVI